ncbi:aldo/keto reductase [Stigmatella erecta]|uniref:Aldo/keto reductase n=1 Tax=Stigmatella erecta TaxID=83460 RepID=A0A1I0LBW9_9BACT|nr:aldo/keto reductase [Stigmatella erecta]SEU37646.1 Aldo/keto reductase [Stigmatella erecta]
MSRFHRRAFLHASGLALAAAATGRVWAAPPETPRMRTRPIPSTQEALPVIGMGTWQTFDVGPGAEARAPLEEVLRTFVALGGTLVDSSPMYGHSEEVVGTLAEKTGLQPKLFLATKVWTSGKAEGVRQMEDSLRKLRTQRVDLMEVHNLVDAGTHLDTLRAWKEKGRVRYVGVTHYTASAHDAVAKLLQSRPVDFVQINYSVGEREAEQRLLSVAQERGVAVIANRPFAGGGLLQRLKRKPLPPWAAELDCDSWAQLLLKFVISHPAVTCAIPATSKPSHLRDNMKAGLGRLPDETLRARIAAEAA